MAEPSQEIPSSFSSPWACLGLPERLKRKGSQAKGALEEVGVRRKVCSRRPYRRATSLTRAGLCARVGRGACALCGSRPQVHSRRGIQPSQFGVSPQSLSHPLPFILSSNSIFVFIFGHREDRFPYRRPHLSIIVHSSDGWEGDKNSVL